MPMAADLVELVNTHHEPTGFEAAVLERLQRDVGYDVAFFSVKGAEELPTVVGLGAPTIERAARRNPVYALELLPVKEAALAARGVAVDTAVLGERRVRQTAYHRELARPVGGRHSLMAYVQLRGRVIAAVMLGRAGTAFSAANLAAVEAWLPELGVARASYGLPVRFGPLAVPDRAGLLERLGLAERSALLTERRVGDATLQVRDRGGFREMVACSAGSELVWTRAALSDPARSGWPYVELLHLAAVHARSRRRALFIGCGGAVALRQFASVHPGLSLDLVEREAAVVELARAYFDLDAIPGLTVHVADGAELVRGAPAATWDLAVIDAFNGSQAACALNEQPFFAALRRALRPGGAVAVNVIGTLDGYGPVRQITSTLRHAFDSVRVVPVMDAAEEYSPSALRNVVLVALKSG